MKRPSTIKQRELFNTSTRPAVTLPSRAQTEIVRLLSELILEQLNQRTQTTDTKHKELSK